MNKGIWTALVLCMLFCITKSGELAFGTAGTGTGSEQGITAVQSEEPGSAAGEVKHPEYPNGAEVSLDPSWEFADYSVIHSGAAILYRAQENRKNIIIGVNAGHGTAGGDSQYTYCHPDRSPKVTGGSTAVLSQKDLVKKIYFPREVLPISYVSSCFMNMIFSFVPVFIIVYVSCYLNKGVVFVVDNVEYTVEYPKIAGLCCLPVVMLVEYLLALGIAMISSAVTVYFRDLEHILGILCMAWMYATPIVYTPYTLNKLADKSSTSLRVIHFLISKVNPMTPIIEAYRSILCDSEIPKMSTLLSAFLISLIILAIGLLMFNRIKKHFAEEL